MLLLRRKEIERNHITRISILLPIHKSNGYHPKNKQRFSQKFLKIFSKNLYYLLKIYHVSTEISHFHVKWKFSTPLKIVFFFLWPLTIKFFSIQTANPPTSIFILKQPKYWKHIVLCIVTAKKPKNHTKNLLQ